MYVRLLLFGSATVFKLSSGILSPTCQWVSRFLGHEDSIFKSSSGEHQAKSSHLFFGRKKYIFFATREFDIRGGKTLGMCRLFPDFHLTFASSARPALSFVSIARTLSAARLSLCTLLANIGKCCHLAQRGQMFDLHVRCDS